MDFLGPTRVRQGRGAVLGFVLLFGGAPAGLAAKGAATPAEMLKEAFSLLEAGRHEDAAATMYMYIGAVEESQAPRVVAIAQDIRFRLASILVQGERLDEAAAVLQDYLALPIAARPRQARRMLAICLYETGDYEACVTAATNALAFDAEIVEVARRVAKGAEGEDEDDQFLDAEPEPRYTPAELAMLHLVLAESYFALERWAECIEPFEYVAEHAADGQRKGYAIMQVVNALIEIPDFERISLWIPQLYRTDARFDIRVNLALINAATALYDAGEYDSALPLYRMILPRDEVVAFQEKRLRRMRIDAGMPPAMDEEMTSIEKLLFGVDDGRAAESEVRDAATGLLVGKPKEMVELENLVIALKALPPYEDDVGYRMAEIYKAVERHWEAVEFFGRVFAAGPESEIGERSAYELVQTLLDDLGEQAEAERFAYDYMRRYQEGITPRQIAYLLTGHYQRQAAMEPVKALKPFLDGFVRTNEATIVQYDAELYFMQAVADLVLKRFAEAEASFRFVLDRFPGSHQEANARYWRAMAMLFQQKYEAAFPEFEHYVARFPSEGFVDEASFQGGVCLFGMERYDEALARFTRVIDTWPDSPIYPEACSMRGDILGSQGLLDEAVADYRRAMAAATKPGQATYAVFQMAAVFEAEDKYDDILGAVEAYLGEWRAEADLAKALFWIGKTKIQQKRVDEAVATYLDAIATYGADVRQDGVDLMIAELVKVAVVYLDEAQRGRLEEALRAALEAAADPVLRLRLRVALAKLEGKEVELGRQLILELPDLDDASPPVLAAICAASFALEDYSRAEEMLRIFHDRFEDSDFMRAAYKLRGFGRHAEGDLEGALGTIAEAQALYGTDYDAAWAQLLKARILLEQGLVEEAREANRAVLSVPSWRGEPVAQATYQLGQVEEAAGDPRRAFGFYQRTYFQYKGHADGHWAAEAYLASARCLQAMGLENDRRNTFRAMLFDPYVNTRPQAGEARRALGADEVAGIEAYLATGATTNIAVQIEAAEPGGEVP